MPIGSYVVIIKLHVNCADDDLIQSLISRLASEGASSLMSKNHGDQVELVSVEKTESADVTSNFTCDGPFSTSLAV